MRSKIISLSNTWHFFAILVALIGLSLVSLWYLAVLFIYLIYLFKIRFLKLRLLILIVIYLMVLSFLYLYLPIPNNNELKGFVINIKQYDNYQALTIQNGIKKYLVYYYGEDSVYIGYKATFNGTFKELDYSEYSIYLKSQGIYNTMSSRSASFSQGISLYAIKGKLLEFYDKRLDDKSFLYLKSLVFAQNEFDTEIKDAISNLGISYLFCISGFHVSLIAGILEKVLSKLTKNSFVKDIVIILFLIFYSFLCNFSYGIVRATLMYIITKINFYKQFNLTKLDICSIAFLLIVIMNPMALYSLSLRLSFIVTFFIIIGSSIINDKNKIMGSYKMAIMAFIVSAPLVISVANKVNLLTMIISPIILILFSVIILPSTYALLILPGLWIISSKMYKIFELIILKLDSISFFVIRFPTLTPIMIILYYGLILFLFIKIETKAFKLKHMLYFIGLCLLLINYNKIIPYDRVIMLDVGQGDSILISKAFNKGNILIDSYNNLDRLDELGINRIDTLIITHSDNDHIDTAKDVIGKYKVNCLISSAFDDSSEIKELKKLVLKSYEVKHEDSKIIADIKLEFLGPVIKNTEMNNNSLVFKATINKTTILFTGDMEKEEEELIFSKRLAVDVLKVPHHGSNSSLSEAFMNNCKFDNAIISVGKNNQFGHPNKETLVKLKDANIYRTDEVGNIYINVFSNKYRFEINKDKNTIIILKNAFKKIASNV